MYFTLHKKYGFFSHSSANSGDALFPVSSAPHLVLSPATLCRVFISSILSLSQHQLDPTGAQWVLLTDLEGELAAGCSWLMVLGWPPPMAPALNTAWASPRCEKEAWRVTQGQGGPSSLRHIRSPGAGSHLFSAPSKDPARGRLGASGQQLQPPPPIPTP